MPSDMWLKWDVSGILQFSLCSVSKDSSNIPDCDFNGRLMNTDSEFQGSSGWAYGLNQWALSLCNVSQCSSRHAGSGCQCERPARLIITSINQSKKINKSKHTFNKSVEWMKSAFTCIYTSLCFCLSLFFCLFCKAESWNFLKEASCGGQQVEARLHPETQGSKWNQTVWHIQIHSWNKCITWRRRTNFIV